MIDQTVQKYCEELKKIGIGHKIIEHPELKTPVDTLGYLRLDMSGGASTMILKADDSYIAVVRRDDCKLDFEKLKEVVGTNNLRMATDEEFGQLIHLSVGAARIYNPGIKTYLDKRLFGKECVIGGSGSFTCSIQYRVEDLKKIPDSSVVDVTLITKKSNILEIERKRILSGINPSGSGSLHIGNYLGAVRQFKELAKNNDCFLFIADLHALTTVQDKTQLQKNVEELILNEMALLGDLSNITFFRQSDVPQHSELTIILNNITPLGLIKRAHAYKDKLQKEMAEDEINMGLFSYPVLMAADILMYKPDLVPVGRDQKQHVEITRDIAERFNKTFKKKVFPLPAPYIPEEVAVIMGVGGKRKMSKSLGNIISIFEEESVIKKQVMSTYTDPTRIHADSPGHIEGNMVFTYLDFFAEEEKVEELKDLYKEGKVSDVEVKNYLFESLMSYFKDARERYQELKTNPEKVKKILQDGAEKARTVAKETMEEVREVIGLTNQYSFFRY